MREATAVGPERRRFEMPAAELLQAVAASVRGLETGADSPMAERVSSLVGEAGEAFVAAARPRGLWQRISRAAFEEVLHADGASEPATPLAQVIEDAAELALFAVTLGDAIAQRVAHLFAAGDLAGGYILDQIASQAADELAQRAARLFEAAAPRAGSAALPYSPGYCGWNVAGQHSLFAALEPAEIGISLNDSCLMQPLKSVSGVLVLAPLAAHDFSPAFPCCAGCATLDCRERVAALAARLAAG
jgi:hypothetical protein